MKLSKKKFPLLAAIVTAAKHEPIPADWEVQPIAPGQEAEDPATCGECGLTWDDGIPTGMTPAPSGRCPFEPFHIHDEDEGAGGEQSGTSIVDTQAALECAEYLMESEADDYHEWCAENGCDPQDMSNPHIYVVACKAVGLKPEVR